MTNVDRFCEAYQEELTRAVVERPEEYAYPVAEVPAVVERMRAAFIRGSFNHDGLAIRRTAKRLGLKPTRGALLAFFQGGA